MKNIMCAIALLFLCDTTCPTYGALEQAGKRFKDSFSAFPDEEKGTPLDISKQVATLQSIDVDHAFSNRESLLKTMFETIRIYKQREKKLSTTLKEQYHTFSNALLETFKEQDGRSEASEKFKKIKSNSVLAFDEYLSKSQELVQTLNTQLANKVDMLRNTHEQDAASLSQELTHKSTQVRGQVESSIQAQKQGLVQKTKGLSKLKQRCLTTLEIETELAKRKIKCYKEINEAKINEQRTREARALEQEIKDAKQQLELRKITESIALEEEIERRRALLREKKRADMEELNKMKLLMQEELQSKMITAHIVLEEELSTAYERAKTTNSLLGMGLQRKTDHDLRALESQHAQKLDEIHGHIDRFQQYQKEYTDLLIKIKQDPTLVLETQGRPPRYILSPDEAYIERVDRGELPKYRKETFFEKTIYSYYAKKLARLSKKST